MKRYRLFLLILCSLAWGREVVAVAPDWSVNPADYELSAALTAVVLQDFSPIGGSNDQVAAFAGSQVRGVATPIEVLDTWIFFLTLYGAADGEELTFKVYNAVEDTVLAAQETIVFKINNAFGSPLEPFELNTTLQFDFRPSVQQIPDQIIEVGAVFAPIDLDDFVEILDGDGVSWSASGPNYTRPLLLVDIDANNIATISPPSPDWVGTATLEFTAVEENADRLLSQETVLFTVRPVDQAPEIGVIPNQTVRQFRTFASFDLDDYLNSADGDPVGWSFDFPASTPQNPPTWSVAVEDYQAAMNITAVVEVGGQAPPVAAHILAAFAKDASQPSGLGAVRGVAAPILVEGKQHYFLTIFANENGEEIVLRFYDAEHRRIYPVDLPLSFAASASQGSPEAPLALQAGFIAIRLDSDHVVQVEVLDASWTASETVLFIATDQGTAKELTEAVEVTFTVAPAQLILGDVSGDGDVSSLDVAWILEHTVFARALSGLDSVAAEVSGNGFISPFDGSLVLQYVVSLIDQFPVESGGAGKSFAGQRRVYLGAVERTSTDQWALPVLIDEMAGVVAGEVELVLSGTVQGKIQTAELTRDYWLAEGVVDGRLRAAFAGAVAPRGQGRLLEVIVEDPALLDGIRLERVVLNEGAVAVQLAETATRPSLFDLQQNYPNPFNPETTIHFEVGQTGPVQLAVYGMSGQRVRTLVEGARAAGTYAVVWDGRDDVGRQAASGLYLVQLQAGEYRAARKMLLVR